MAITRGLGRALDRVSPSISSRVRSVWYTLNGHRAEDLLLRQQKADEWRFRDLKDFLQAIPKPADTAFAVQDSVERLARLGHSKGVAVVSVLPPATTGIANFTLRTFGAADAPVDVFFPHNGTAEYLSTTYRLGRAGSPVSYFSLESLDAGLAKRGYRAVIWVLGNSDHHIEVVRMLRAARHMPISIPAWIEVHDPVLLNVASKIARMEGSDLAHIVQDESSSNLVGIDWERANSGDHAQLIERGVTGIRALLNDVPHEGLIFHSQAAREIAFRDWPNLAPSRASVLFHPAFDPFEKACSKPRNKGLRIGSFGVPGPAKETNTVIGAFRLIRAHYPDATLTLAGYDMAEYVRRECLSDEPGLIFVDSPTNERLLDLMREVDIAVQLRARNTGESSGIVPQLLSLDRPVIASAVGALTDYGDAVGYVQSGCTPEDLMAIIIDEANFPERRSQAREDFVASHSPNRFLDEVLALIGSADQSAPASEGSTPPQGQMDVGHGAGSSGSTDVIDPMPATWLDFERIIKESGADKDHYIQTHLKRYRHTLAAVEQIVPPEGGSALEVGTSWLFAVLMRSKLGLTRVDVTDFMPGDERKVVSVNLNSPSFTGQIQAFNVNLEADPLPTEAEQYDLVLCCEVLEHMDVDPMFMLAELNRVMRTGGKLLLTTPNVTSSRNVGKILEGYAPHFFMQYHKDRSPYRHNIEYAPDQVSALVTAAGFRVDRLWTADTFEEPAPDMIELLDRLGFPTHARGDNMFVVATKESGVRDRHPPTVYV